MALTRRLLIATALVAAVAAVAPPRALAACHAFIVSVNPATVAEGGTVTVTVGRDFNANPSSVDVSTVNGSAVAGQDYTGVQRTLSMSTETSQSFTVATTNDTAPEAAETFKIHLSNGSGCSVNPNFQYGPDATVTIQDNDAAPAPTAAPTAPATAAPTTARATSTTAVTTTTVAAETSTSVEDTTTSDVALGDDLAADEDEDNGGGGGSAVLAVLAIILIAGIGGLGYTLYRRRAA
jgi:hypothetical protein